VWPNHITLGPAALLTLPIETLTIYEVLLHHLRNDSTISRLQDEWHHPLISGPPVSFNAIYQDVLRIDEMNTAFQIMIVSGQASANQDHSTAGENNDGI